MTALARVEPEVLGELRCPAVRRREMLAELRRMQLRGEIAYAFNLREEAGGILAVSYVKLRDPRPRTPLYVTAFCVATGAVAGLAGMLYHARHVFAAVAGLLVAGLALFALAWLIATIIRALSGRGHCPGAWHR